MRLTLVAPFRIPFRLPKDEILANHSKWIEVINDAEKQLKNTGLPGAAVGNYGWGRLKQLQKEGKVFYGETGKGDPGWFFREYYLLRIEGQLAYDEITSSTDHSRLIELIKGDENRWEFRLIDNTIAILVYSFKVDVRKFFEYITDNDSSLITMDNISNWDALILDIQGDTNNLAKKLLMSKLEETNQLDKIKTIEVNQLTEEMQNDIVDAFNDIKNNLTFYKDEVVGNGINLSSEVKEELNKLDKLLEESGVLKKEECDLSDLEKEDIKWFNITILTNLFPKFFSKKPNFDNNLEACTKSVNNWSKKLLEIHEKNKLEESIKWCYENLFKPMGFKLEQDDNTGYFIDKESPILGYKLAIEDKKSPPIDIESSNYGKFYKRLWAHWAYIFEPKEKNNLSEFQKGVLKSLLYKDSATEWLKGKDNNYNWGTTAVVTDESYGDQWLDALCISEYYYTCIDLADTKLPIAIAKQRSYSKRGQHKQALETASQTRNDLRILLSEYSDLLVRSGAEAYSALKTYYDVWRMKDLIDGMNKKIQLLEELIAASSDTINTKNQYMIQHILFGITLLSVIGLFASLHEYLAHGYDPRLPEMLSTYALDIGKGKVLLASLLTAILAFVAFFFVSRRK